MATQGPRFPSAASDLGDGQSTWSNTGNVYAQDGNSASTFVPVATKGGSISDTLYISHFGFSLPATAAVQGILVEAYGSGNATVNIYKNGTIVGTPYGTGFTNTMSGTGYVPFGSSTSLWGGTYTGADINNAAFGVGFIGNNSSSNNGVTVSIDAVRVTVYYADSLLPVNMSLPKRHIYKVYNNGQYVGNLPNVVSPFQFSQDINSAGPGNITVTCAISPDTAAMPNSGALMDESGNTLTDEAGNVLTQDGGGVIFGIGSSSAMIRNGNQVIVWEYGYYSVNGRPMFSGTIEKWEAQYGGGDETINVLIYHDGQDLDNHILTGPPYAYTVDQNGYGQQDGYVTIRRTGPDQGGAYSAAGQTWIVGSGVTNLGMIQLYMNGAANVTVNVYSSPFSTTILASTSVNVNTNGGVQNVQFAFSQPVKVTPGASYFFGVTVDANQSISIFWYDQNQYANGSMYEINYNGSAATSAWVQYANYDLLFATFSSNGSTTATYTSADPTTGMLVPVMNDYISKGGLIGYTSSSIQATGLSLTASFNTQSILEGINSFLSFAPNGFYWYVDPGTDILYFKQANLAADFKLTKGVHMDSIKIVATIENVKNTILFTGGTPAGQTTNLYKVYQDATSISEYGVRLDRQSDNRVTVGATADAIGNSSLAEQKNELYQTVVTVLDKQMDIGALKVGLVVGFNGFGGFVDNLLSQIVRIDYTPDEATLTLGILPVRLNSAFEEVTRGLAALQTVANPTSPS